MFIGLHYPLVKGETFPVVLKFQNAKSQKIMIQVKGVGTR